MANQVTVEKSKVVIKTPQGDQLRQDKLAAANNPLDGLTLTQALTWVDANVSDLASARSALKQIVKLIFVQRK
jgi:hypothetical protein